MNMSETTILRFSNITNVHHTCRKRETYYRLIIAEYNSESKDIEGRMYKYI